MRAQLADLAAGGSLPRAVEIAAPSRRRRLRLIAEIGALFIALPMAVLHVVVAHRMPLFLVLQPILLAFLAYLLWDATFRVRDELSRGIALSELASILAVFLVAGGTLAALVADTMPGKFLSLPRYRPEVWKKILLFYPLLSVVAQELVYRTFFFHRYGPLFNGHRGLMIVANGALFGFGHVMFGNWIAVAGTAVVGMLLAYRYEVTRSFWAVWIEHTLWGWLVFTIGLGSYFFTGVSSTLLR